MPKPRSLSGEKSLVGQRLIELRNEQKLSQRDLAHKLQLVHQFGLSDSTLFTQPPDIFPYCVSSICFKFFVIHLYYTFRTSNSPFL